MTTTAHTPEMLADLAAIESVGTRVVASNFVPGRDLHGTITQAPASGGFQLLFDNPAAAQAYWADLTPTVAEAIGRYQIVREAITEGEDTSGLIS